MSFLSGILNEDLNVEYTQKIVEAIMSKSVENNDGDSIETEYFTHTVRSGEILYTLAKRYGIKMNKIAELNPEIRGKVNIEPGMELKIPKYAA